MAIKSATKLGDIKDILRCPYCNEEFFYFEEEPTCLKDQQTFPRIPSGGIDFRLKQTKSVSTTFHIEPDPVKPDEIPYRILKKNDAPMVDFSGIDKLNRYSEIDLSYFPKAPHKDSIALDLGCGPMVFQEVIERAGYRYVGLDIADPKAFLLGDAQALPFADESFDFVFANAMMQYVSYPFSMVDEVNRVLRPGGVFFGTASFTEGFDGSNFYLYTRNGIVNLLHHGQFIIEFLAPDTWWTAVVAVSKNGLFPGLSPQFYRILSVPIEFLSKSWWQLIRLKGKKYSEAEWLAHTTAGFTFLARKEMAMKISSQETSN